MNKQNVLYQLPGHLTLAGLAKRCLAGWLGLIVAVLWWGTQRVAFAFHYHAALGPPWLVVPEEQRRLVVGTLLLVGLLLGFAALSRRLWRLIFPVAVLYGFAALAANPIYMPLHVLAWAIRFRGIPQFAPYFAPVWAALAVVAGVGAVLAFVIFLVLAPKVGAKGDLHGSARWATAHDIRQAGLWPTPKPPAAAAPLLQRLRHHLGDAWAALRREPPPSAGLDGQIAGGDGIFLGLAADGAHLRPLYSRGPTHVFVFAPTRSGKGVGLVIPNLLNWPHSVLVHDIKGENWQITAGWRERHANNVCLRFDPTSTDRDAVAHYNPLQEVRIHTPNDVRDAQNVADILVDPNGDRLRDHWDRTAHELLTGVILHVLYHERDKTLHGCAEFLASPRGAVVRETIEGMLEKPWGPDNTAHPVIAAAARAWLDKSPNEGSSIISTALSFLSLYRDPLVAQNTERSDFRIADLMNNEKPLSLYLTVPASDLSRTRPLVRLLLNQVCRRLTETIRYEKGVPVQHYKHPLLLVLDEFPALGRLPFFTESLAYLAGYGIRSLLITQDLSQHQGVYGKEESITANCAVRIAFTPNKPETAQLLSQMAGDATIHVNRRTYQLTGGLASRASLSTADVRRPLLTPEETTRLPADDALIFVAGHPAIWGRRARYFADPVLRERSAIPAPLKVRPVLARPDASLNALTAPAGVGRADSLQALPTTNGPPPAGMLADAPPTPPPAASVSGVGDKPARARGTRAKRTKPQDSKLAQLPLAESPQEAAEPVADGSDTGNPLEPDSRLTSDGVAH